MKIVTLSVGHGNDFDLIPVFDDAGAFSHNRVCPRLRVAYTVDRGEKLIPSYEEKVSIDHDGTRYTLAHYFNERNQTPLDSGRFLINGVGAILDIEELGK